MANILLYDIETTHLKADWGWTICIGWKWLDSKGVYVKSLMDYPDWKQNLTNDRALVEEFHRVMSEADMRVGFYSRGFDIKFLQSKWLQYELPPLPQIPEVDLFFVAKSNLALTRKNLDNITRFLGLDQKKYYVTAKIWQQAMVGNPDAIRKIMAHCRQDVRITEQLYYKLRPYIRTHPRTAGYYNCRYCGSDKVQRRGYQMSIYKGKQVRVQCQSCFGWSSYPEQDITTLEKGSGSLPEM